MTEQFAITYAALRAKQQGWGSFDLQLRTFGLNPGESQAHQVVDGMWLLTEVDGGMQVSSDNGEWDRTQKALPEMAHEHSGQITLTNRAEERQFVTLVQVTWLDSNDGIAVPAT